MTKRLLIVLLLCSVLGAFAPGAGASERAETLRAINWVENPTNHTRRGSKGELGPYQFRAQTWRLHTTMPFQLAVVREHADEIAVKHYEWIRQGLLDAGIEPTPFNIALAWNSGLAAVQRGRVPTVSYGYAQRVTNLVEAQRRQVAGTAVAALPAAPATPRFAVEPGVQFVAGGGPRFTLEAPVVPEPVVVTEKSPAPVVAALAVEGPVIRVDENALTFMGAAAPRFALLK
jgi:hypothetical protein